MKTYSYPEYQKQYYLDNKETYAKRDLEYNKNPKRIAYKKQYNKDRKTAHQEWLNTNYKNKPCLDCGNSYPPECMDFDHIDDNKNFHISNGHHKSREIVIKEIEKCELVCANCHRIRTKKRI